MFKSRAQRSAFQSIIRLLCVTLASEGEPREMAGTVYPARNLCHCECINCHSSLPIPFFVILATVNWFLGALSGLKEFIPQSSQTTYPPKGSVLDCGNTADKALPAEVG